MGCHRAPAPREPTSRGPAGRGGPGPKCGPSLHVIPVFFLRLHPADRCSGRVALNGTEGSSQAGPYTSQHFSLRVMAASPALQRDA